MATIVNQNTDHNQSGIKPIAADKPDVFLDDIPTAKLIRQALGAVSEFEKAMVGSKLKGARDRRRATGVKVEGRKNYAEISPEMVALAKKLRRYKVQGRKRTLREVASELARAGFITGIGKPNAAAAVAKMIEA
jgi:DNA invertase Pin-like site-specific DNA recombinase